MAQFVRELTLQSIMGWHFKNGRPNELTEDLPYVAMNTFSSVEVSMEISPSVMSRYLSPTDWWNELELERWPHVTFLICAIYFS